MIERAKHDKKEPTSADERITMLDDRLLHMTREEAKAYLDAYLQQRGLANGRDPAEDVPKNLASRP